ncbi:hypothetical protein PAPYR_3484 [Paratrimastix pyriformis]|uniref:Uncharacterized protein n=1 Tax=Paratrimastix pyriformis TaxID=342808 RepID=A0ABQ8UQ73_9EUKA|nr:hypothetical protein PAPYR_3484 [Paratrimastix pyriformis]
MPALVDDKKSKIVAALLWCIIFPGSLIVILYFVQMLVGSAAAGKVGAISDKIVTNDTASDLGVQKGRMAEIAHVSSAVAVFALLIDLTLLFIFLPYIKNFWSRCPTVKKWCHWICLGLIAIFGVGYLVCNIYQMAVVFAKNISTWSQWSTDLSAYPTACAVANLFITLLIFIFILTPGFFFLYFKVHFFYALMKRWTDKSAVLGKVATAASNAPYLSGSAALGAPISANPAAAPPASTGNPFSEPSAAGSAV